jgi:hypothetical protein
MFEFWQIAFAKNYSIYIANYTDLVKNQQYDLYV